MTDTLTDRQRVILDLLAEGQLHPKGKGAWYFIYTRACVICGRTVTERERRHDPKPDDPMKRHEYVEGACGVHFV